MTAIALFGPATDAEVCALRDRLESRGAEPWVIDLARFPAILQVSLADTAVTVDSRDLFSSRAAFVRGRGVVIPDYAHYDGRRVVASPDAWRGLHGEYSRYVVEERGRQAVRASVIARLERVRPVVNSLAANDQHRLKTVLLRRLSRAGVPVPPFVIGTERAALRKFALEADGGVVDKPTAGVYKTKVWTEERWREHPWRSRAAFYQHRISGDTIRCYVVAGKLVASAAILHEDTVDSSASQTGIRVLELPEPAGEVLQRCAALLGLHFCGIDLMHDRTANRYFVVDCNMSPMFVNFSRQSGIDIAGLLADHLLELAGTPRHAALAPLAAARDILARDPDIRAMLRRDRRHGTRRHCVAVVGRKNDEHVTSIVRELEERSCDCRLVDMYNYPRYNLLTQGDAVTYDDIHVAGELAFDKAELLFIRALPSAPSPTPSNTEGLRRAGLADRAAFASVCSLLTRLGGRAAMVNSLAASAFHRLKPYQYRLLAARGVPVPATMTTANLEAARRFVEGIDGGAVVKPCTSGTRVVMADEAFFRSAARLHGARPWLFQQFVSGASYRAYVLGGTVASFAELHFDRAEVDWRERVTGATPTAAPDMLVAQIGTAVETLGLAYCSIDIEYDNRTRAYYLLDLNPAGLYTGWSRLVGCNMAALIADYLVGVMDHGGRLWQRTWKGTGDEQRET